MAHMISDSLQLAVYLIFYPIDKPHCRVKRQANDFQGDGRSMLKQTDSELFKNIRLSGIPKSMSLSGLAGIK